VLLSATRVSCALRVTRLRRREREEKRREEKRSAERLGARVTLSLGDTRDSVTREIRCTELGATKVTREMRRVSLRLRRCKRFSRTASFLRRISRVTCAFGARLRRRRSLARDSVTRAPCSTSLAEGALSREIRCKSLSRERLRRAKNSSCLRQEISSL